MDVRDIKKYQLPEVDTEDRLVLIFARQKELRSEYIHIERDNGFYCPDNDCVNLHDRQYQGAIKDLAWRITEEIAEAVDAWKRTGDYLCDQSTEEIADALHFLVELGLLSGIDVNSIPNLNQGDKLTELFSEQCLDRPAALSYEDFINQTIVEFITSLGMLCHLLKNKPWKQSHIMTDIPEYKLRYISTFHKFIYLCKAIGMNADKLFDLYFRKSEVNKFRQRSKY